MYTLYKFHFLNGISEINQLSDDILIIWPAPVYGMTWGWNLKVIVFVWTVPWMNEPKSSGGP